MAKAIFTISITKNLNQSMKKDIRESIIGSKEMVKEIKRVLQQANRRAQNIEKSGVISPAYQALVLEGRTGYSKFSITGTKIGNEASWERAKYEYAKAIEYLNNPTSSATGAKQYVKHISNKYKVPQEIANNIIAQATSTQFSNGKIPLMNYREMIDSYYRDSQEEKTEMQRNAKEHAEQLERNVQQQTEAVYNAIDDVTDDIINSFNGFKIK